MTSGRFYSLMTLAIILNFLLIGAIFVDTGLGADTGKSGLDFNQGYDINTVTTVSGRVASLPHEDQRDNYVFEIKNGAESISIAIGPGSFWEKKELPVRLNDEITAKGSKAQGQDGKLYLLTQKLVNRTTGAQLELRNDKGEPAWSGRDVNVIRPERPTGLDRQTGGASWGTMMRGGGGMMRR